MDMVVNDAVIVEIKATEIDHAVHQAQLLTYLRLTGKKLGLLINFGKGQIKDGITRLVF
jgi:GxxExxY protein